MRSWIGVGVLASTLILKTLAQTAAPPAAPGASTAITPPAASPPPAATRGATINAATGEVVPGTVAPDVLAGQTGAPPAATNRTAVLRAATNAVAATPSRITPAQLQNINRLDVELNRLALTSRDPVDQQRGLIELLQSAPIGNTRPAPAVVARLGEQLADSVRTLNLTAQQRRQLAIDLNLALNSASLSAAEAQRVLGDVRGILQGARVANPQATEPLLTSLTSLVNQLQGNVAQTVPPASGAASHNDTSQTSATGQAGQSAAGQTGQGSGGSPPPSGATGAPPDSGTP